MVNNINNAWKNLINSPIYQYLPDKDKQDIQWLKTINPKLFEGQPKIEPVKTELQTTTELAQKKALQANLYGGLGYDIYQKFVKYGLAPEGLEKLNWLGRMRVGATYPLQKVLSIAMAFPRAWSATQTEMVRQVGVEEAKKYGFLYKPPVEKGVPVSLKETLKQE